jgi:uncharacterized membrane protein
VVDVTTTVRIDRPVEVVAGYVSDPSNAPEWYVNIRAVDLETPPPLAIGSEVRFEARFLGRTLRSTYEITDLVPNSRLVMATAQGPFPMETIYTWEPVDAESTIMTLRNRGQPAGFSRLAAPFVGAAMRRANTEDLRRLKEILERNPA